MTVVLWLVLCQVVQAAELEVTHQQVVEQARRALGTVPVGQQLEVTSRPSSARIQEGTLAWRTSVLASVEESSPRVRVSLLVDGQARCTWLVSFRKTVQTPMLVAARALSRGQRPTGEDVRLETRPAGPGEAWLSSAEELVGLELRHNLAPGAVLRPGDFTRAVLLPAGQNVNVTIRREGLLVRLPGRTLEPAMYHQPFRVRTASGSVVTAVIGPEGDILCTIR